MTRLLLAGANWRERSIDALGALIGIALAGWLSTALAGDAQTALLLAAPIGASAVLVFAVPSSPLGQPWPVIGGNVVAAATGIVAARWLGPTALAAGVAVSGAIVAMSALRCLHPSGGGSALLGVVGGPAVLSHGLAYALVPVGLNAIVLVLAGIAFHRLSGQHSYPHRPVAMPEAPRFDPEDLDAALAEAGEPFDIARADLEALLASAERHARARRRR